MEDEFDVGEFELEDVDDVMKLKICVSLRCVWFLFEELFFSGEYV